MSLLQSEFDTNTIFEITTIKNTQFVSNKKNNIGKDDLRKIDKMNETRKQHTSKNVPFEISNLLCSAQDDGGTKTSANKTFSGRRGPLSYITELWRTMEEKRPLPIRLLRKERASQLHH